MVKCVAHSGQPLTGRADGEREYQWMSARKSLPRYSRTAQAGTTIDGQWWSAEGSQMDNFPWYPCLAPTVDKHSSTLRCTGAARGPVELHRPLRYSIHQLQSPSGPLSPLTSVLGPLTQSTIATPTCAIPTRSTASTATREDENLSLRCACSSSSLKIASYPNPLHSSLSLFSLVLQPFNHSLDLFIPRIVTSSYSCTPKSRSSSPRLLPIQVGCLTIDRPPLLRLSFIILLTTNTITNTKW